LKIGSDEEFEEMLMEQFRMFLELSGHEVNYNLREVKEISGKIYYDRFMKDIPVTFEINISEIKDVVREGVSNIRVSHLSIQPSEYTGLFKRILTFYKNRTVFIVGAGSEIPIIPGGKTLEEFAKLDKPSRDLQVKKIMIKCIFMPPQSPDKEIAGTAREFGITIFTENWTRFFSKVEFPPKAVYLLKNLIEYDEQNRRLRIELGKREEDILIITDFLAEVRRSDLIVFIGTSLPTSGTVIKAINTLLDEVKRGRIERKPILYCTDKFRDTNSPEIPVALLNWGRALVLYEDVRCLFKEISI